MSQSATLTPHQRDVARRAVIASSVGNALEWFDIIVYASFAVVISRLFFPAVDGVTALLFTFGAFATSYLIRPIGALVLGSYSDRKGRKSALTLTHRDHDGRYGDHGAGPDRRGDRSGGRPGHPRFAAAARLLRRR